MRDLDVGDDGLDEFELSFRTCREGSVMEVFL